MLIFLYGKDSYRRKQKQKEIISIYKRKHPQFDFKRFDLAEDNFEDLMDFLDQPSLFENFKLALVDNIFKVNSKKLINFLKIQLNRKKTTLIISEDSCPEKEFEFLTKSPVISQKFQEMDQHKLVFFIEKEAQKLNLKLKRDVVNFLARYGQNYGQDKSWFIVNELKKIKLAKFSQPVDLTKILNFFPYLNSEGIFKLINNFNLVNLEKLLFRTEPAYIFNLLGTRKKLVLKFAEYDVKIKSGKLDYQTALLDFVLSKLLD